MFIKSNKTQPTKVDDLHFRLQNRISLDCCSGQTVGLCIANTLSLYFSLSILHLRSRFIDARVIKNTTLLSFRRSRAHGFNTETTLDIPPTLIDRNPGRLRNLTPAIQIYRRPCYYEHYSLVISKESGAWIQH